MVPSNFMLGTQEALDFYTALREELKARVAAGQGAVQDEKYRLLWGGGLPAWFALADFDYFASKGASFPVEITYRLFEPVHNLDLRRRAIPGAPGLALAEVLDVLARCGPQAARLLPGSRAHDTVHRGLPR